MQRSGTPTRPARRRILVATASLALLALITGPRHALAQAARSAPSPSPNPSPAPGGKGGPAVRIGVIGAGNIGGTVGGLWVKAGHPVMFSSRHPEELKSLVEGLGPLARAGTVAEAIAFADVLFLAVPYKAVPELGQQYGAAMSGKVMVDATNAIPARDGAPAEEAARNGIGATTAKYLRGVRIVRAFNSMPAGTFAKEHHRSGGLIAIPIAGDDPDALSIGAQLVRDAGFEPVVVGPLASADRFTPGGKLFHQIGSAAELRAAMAR